MEKVLHHAELAIPADERRLQALGSKRSTPAADHADGSEQLDRLGLALQLVQARLLVDHGGLGGAAGALAPPPRPPPPRRLPPRRGGRPGGGPPTPPPAGAG